MVYERERERRNDAVFAEHKSAVAAGEKRVFRTTSTGDLHSYPGDEIGFSSGRGQVQVSTWWGMGSSWSSSESCSVRHRCRTSKIHRRKQVVHHGAHLTVLAAQTLLNSIRSREIRLILLDVVNMVLHVKMHIHPCGSSTKTPDRKICRPETRN